MYKDTEEIRPGLYIKNGRQIKPILKDIRKPLSWENLHWRNLLFGDVWTLVMICCFIFLSWAYVHDTDECMVLLERPCSYCSKIDCPGCSKPLVTDEFRSMEGYNDYDEFLTTEQWGNFSI